MSEHLEGFANDEMTFQEMFTEMKTELHVKLKQASEFYEFDFGKEKPIEDQKRFCWTKVYTNS